jgi:hypothetical protein
VAKAMADPSGNGAPTPSIAAWSWPRDGSTQILLLLLGE